MAVLENHTFDIATFLAKAGLGRRIVQLAPKQTFFSQGDPADSVFYLQNGRARVTVVSAIGKEATITLVPRASLSERERWRQYPDCAYPRPRPLQPAPRSR
jgi:CRP-like cAMP-binding protein